MMDSKRLSMGLLLPGALLLAKATLAQQAGPSANTASASSEGLEEITVTASRREETASKVPISLTAFTQKTLDENIVRSVDDIAKMTPGVQFTRNSDYSGAVANISIRGVASDAGSGATGIYIDDTPIQNRASFSGLGSSVWPQIFDLERVEVLRGPQGTLFGAGSEGGTVRFITPQPSTTKYDLYARSDLAFTKGGDPSQEIGAAVNVPLIDGVLGLRFSASYRHDGGYVNRLDPTTGYVAQPGSNYDNISTLRIAMAYDATDDLTFTPSFYWQKIYINDSSAYWEPLSDPGSDSFNRSSNIRNTTTDLFSLPALKVQWRLPIATLTSNTSYYQREQPSVQDLAFFESDVWANQPIPPPNMYAPSYDDTEQRNFTQEVRLASNDSDGRVTWLVGVFYTNNWQQAAQNVQDTFLPGLIQQNYGITMAQ
ncbi:MAG TPA: TonB-dependent receptor plug domain-containing protein, partial [Steroidobacteraceae bacterium]|nr:TonB-dependent receptor plug domain-containing protein [Steroidobacteraceae bacterium]